MPRPRLQPLVRGSVFRFGLKSGLSLVALLAAGAAQAQSPAEAPTEVAEIVVTGEKAPQTLQNTTTSVAVITAERIDDETLQSLPEVYNRTANVTSAGGRFGFSIRGISFSSVR